MENEQNTPLQCEYALMKQLSTDYQQPQRSEEKGRLHWPERLLLTLLNLLNLNITYCHFLFSILNMEIAGHLPRYFFLFARQGLATDYNLLPHGTIVPERHSLKRQGGYANADTKGPKAQHKTTQQHLLQCEDIIQNINYARFGAPQGRGPELGIISLLFCTNAPSNTKLIRAGGGVAPLP